MPAGSEATAPAGSYSTGLLRVEWDASAPQREDWASRGRRDPDPPHSDGTRSGCLRRPSGSSGDPRRGRATTSSRHPFHSPTVGGAGALGNACSAALVIDVRVGLKQPWEQSLRRMQPGASGRRPEAAAARSRGSTSVAKSPTLRCRRHPATASIAPQSPPLRRPQSGRRSHPVSPRSPATPSEVALGPGPVRALRTPHSGGSRGAAQRPPGGSTADDEGIERPSDVTRMAASRHQKFV